MTMSELEGCCYHDCHFRLRDATNHNTLSFAVAYPQAQKRLAVYRGLGPAFQDQLVQFREVQRRLLDAQYMLENFNKINSELEDGAVDMMMMMGRSHMDCDDGGFVVY